MEVPIFNSRRSGFIVFFLLSLFTVIINLKKTSAIHAELTGRFRFIDSSGKLLGLIDNESFGSSLINNMKTGMSGIDRSAVKAVKLGHPLIHGEGRVCNDFVLEEKGKICIITGANMAGKSTFLRSVAVNYILAMTGAPVCAEKLLFSPLKLFTSMRTTDSLSSNESYFYAELKRLRILKQKLQDGENIFLMLDEILKGTNSEDKSQGSKIFIDKLISLGGTGLIATHDLSLGELEERYPGEIINKCIEVEIDGEKINFDYILRDGIARNRNAVLLMRQMGILD